MPPFDPKFKLSGRYLSFSEREDIALFWVQAKGVREIARAMSRDPGTISRESHRNVLVHSGSSGRPIRPPVARRSRSWPPTRGYAGMCLSGCQGKSVDPTARSSWGRSRRGSLETTNPTERTAPGRWRGVPSKSRTGPPAISQRMSSCESVTMLFTNRSISRGVVRSSASWCGVRAPVARVTPGTFISDRPSEARDRTRLVLATGKGT